MCIGKYHNSNGDYNDHKYEYKHRNNIDGNNIDKIDDNRDKFNKNYHNDMCTWTLEQL